MIRLSACLILLHFAGSAWAETPRVAADIAPVHSLAARVMDGVGNPDLIMRPGASPHHYALRPSEAAALERATIVLYTSGGLTPWLTGAIETIAGEAKVIELTALPGTLRLPFRKGVAFDGGEDEDEHDHDHAHEHGEGELDPHAWLDPENAKLWMTAIADTLARADPANAELYRANAAEGRAEIDAAAERIAARLAPLRDRPFIVFHDAYQYFEARFGLATKGAISLGDASKPGAARIAELRDRIAELEVGCVFAEPQFDPGLVETVTEGTDTGTAIIDPQGAGIAPGPGHYVATLESIADGMAGCL